jgi:hypothetical protein
VTTVVTDGGDLGCAALLPRLHHELCAIRAGTEARERAAGSPTDAWRRRRDSRTPHESACQPRPARTAAPFRSTRTTAPLAVSVRDGTWIWAEPDKLNT